MINTAAANPHQRHRGAIAFPCDAGGRVDLDAMTEKARVAYLHARIVVGREFFMPIVRFAVLH